MLKELNVAQTYIVCGYTDMRRSIDGLAAIVKQNYGLEPCSGSLFLFCGKRRDRMKALLWAGDGFLLLYKRLDNGNFQWPRNTAEARLLTHEQYIWLMQGLSIDQPKAIKKISGGVDICSSPLSKIRRNVQEYSNSELRSFP
jgi:transposase